MDRRNSGRSPDDSKATAAFSHIASTWRNCLAQQLADKYPHSKRSRHGTGLYPIQPVCCLFRLADPLIPLSRRLNSSHLPLPCPTHNSFWPVLNWLVQQIGEKWIRAQIDWQIIMYWPFLQACWSWPLPEVLFKKIAKYWCVGIQGAFVTWYLINYCFIACYSTIIPVNLVRRQFNRPYLLFTSAFIKRVFKLFSERVDRIIVKKTVCT